MKFETKQKLKIVGYFMLMVALMGLPLIFFMSFLGYLISIGIIYIILSVLVTIGLLFKKIYDIMETLY